jgi:hypothetical protein
MKPVNFNLLKGLISAIFGSMGVGVNADFSYL